MAVSKSAALLQRLNKESAYLMAKRFGGSGSDTGGGTDPGTGGPSFVLKSLDLSLAGNNLFNNADILSIEVGHYSVELDEGRYALIADAPVTTVFPVNAQVTVVDDDNVLGHRVVYWTVATSVGEFIYVYRTITSSGDVLRVVHISDLDIELEDTYRDFELDLYRVGHSAGSAITEVSGSIIKGGPSQADPLVSNIRMAFNASGSISFHSNNPKIQSALDRKLSYWLPFGAEASEYSFKYSVTGNAVDATATTMATTYTVMVGGAQSVALKAENGGTVSSAFVIYIKHNPSDKEHQITVTLQADGAYFS